MLSPDLFRPQRSRYDRPALSLAELLKAEGSNFVFQAVWTIVGERVVRHDHDALMLLLASDGGKFAVLDALVKRLPVGRSLPVLPGLGLALVVERRRNTPVVGPLLAHATIAFHKYPWLGGPTRLVQSIPGKARFAYRHSRKVLVRLGKRMELPTRVEVRRSFGVAHQPALPDMTDRAKWIYEQLCNAIDAPECKVS